MKRSTVNKAVQDAMDCFQKHHWSLPPVPRWDVTDFGLGDFSSYGLVLINLAEEKEYCEKLMYAKKGMHTPMHAHKKKKEDIIVRNGVMEIQVYNGLPDDSNKNSFMLQVNGALRPTGNGDTLQLQAGERVTLTPGIYHEFWPISDECILGEVSTANDDSNDNFFVNPEIGRFSEFVEDEPPLVRLVNDN